MSEAIKQREAQKILGNDVVQYIEICEKFEEKKVNLVKSILKRYMQNNTYNK